MNSQELLELVVRAADSKRAEDIVVLKAKMALTGSYLI